MAPAIDGFLSAILDGKLAHGQNPVLAHAVSGAVTERDAAGNLKLTKAKSHNRIDPIIAAIMATAGAPAAARDGNRYRRDDRLMLPHARS